jgi:hypothetical protein
MKQSAQINHKYRVECHDGDGRLKWVEEFHNDLVTAGLNKYLDATLKTGLASPAWYVGLKDTGSVDPTDTMASHAGWAELTNYTNAPDYRPAWTPGTISGASVDNSGSKAVFNISGADTIYGSFMADEHTKGGSTGTLMGAGDFTTPRAVEIGDTLSVTITCTLSAV